MLQVRIQALESELQDQLTQFTTQHESDVRLAEAAETQRISFASDATQLTQHLSEVLQSQANSLQQSVKSSAAVRALGSDAVANVQSVMSHVLALDPAQTAAFKEGLDGHDSSTEIASLATMHVAAKDMLLMYDELLSASLKHAEQQASLREELQVRPSVGSVSVNAFDFLCVALL